MKSGDNHKLGKARKEPILSGDPARIKHHRRAFWLGGIIVLVVAMAGWWLGQVRLAKISVGNTLVSAHSSNTTLSTMFSQQAGAYRLTIRYPGGMTKKFQLQQLGLTLDTAASLQATQMQQHRLTSHLLWWRPITAVIVLDENVNALNNFVSKSINVIVQPSKDARLTVAKGAIKLTDAIAGKQYGLINPKQVLLAHARTLVPSTITLQTLTMSPALTTALLEPYKTLLARTIGQPAVFKIGNQTIRPSPVQIASWLDIIPNDKTKKLNISVNSGKIATYIDAIAANAIRPARDQVDITHADGSVQVLVPGTDGVDIVNKSGVAIGVAKNLLSGKGFTTILPVSSEPYQTVRTGTYPKWIEVDLTNKILYAYAYTKLVKTYLVSAGAPATPTVTGQYKIYAKYVQQDMHGQNVDGSSYFQPAVPWVNYFYSDFAIHGNYWRPTSYFGNVNSSHGCVGLLDDDAEWIYNWAPIGTPVVIHT